MGLEVDGRCELVEECLLLYPPVCSKAALRMLGVTIRLL